MQKKNEKMISTNKLRFRKIEQSQKKRKNVMTILTNAQEQLLERRNLVTVQ